MASDVPAKPSTRGHAWWRHTIVVLSAAAFAIGFIATTQVLGEAAAVFAVLPAAAAGALIGLGGGLIVTAVVILGILPAFFALFGYPILSIVTDFGSLASIVGSIATCLVAGTMHDLAATVRDTRAQLDRVTRTDALTNLLNRRALMETGEREMKRSFRLKQDVTYYLGRPEDHRETPSPESAHKRRCTIDDYLGVFTCAVIDIDFFSRVNQTFGHEVGDGVLERLARFLSRDECLRESDIAGRLGGEEFLVILTGTSSRNAVYPMERLRKRIESHQFKDATGAMFTVTVSCGISQLNEEDKTLDDILCRANMALDHAKQHGRNLVVVHERDLAESPATPAIAAGPPAGS